MVSGFVYPKKPAILLTSQTRGELVYFNGNWLRQVQNVKKHTIKMIAFEHIHIICLKEAQYHFMRKNSELAL